MVIRRVNEDGTITEEHDFRGTEDAAEAFIAGLKHESGAEIINVATEGEAPFLTLYVTYRKLDKQLFQLVINNNEGALLFKADNAQLCELGDIMSTAINSTAKWGIVGSLTCKIELQTPKDTPWTDEQRQMLLNVADTMLETTGKTKKMGIDVRTNKTVEEGIVKFGLGERQIESAIQYVEYEPGNGTRYRLLIVNLKGTGLDEGPYRNGWIVTYLNSMRSMIVVDDRGLLHFKHVMEKLQCGIADAVCLAEIIGYCTDHLYMTSEEVLKVFR